MVLELQSREILSCMSERISLQTCSLFYLKILAAVKKLACPRVLSELDTLSQCYDDGRCSLRNVVAPMLEFIYRLKGLYTANLNLLPKLDEQ